MLDFAPSFFLYLLVMAGVTYLVRMLPMVLFRRKIENRYIRSFLYYMPYSVLSVMTVPAIFYSTGHITSAAVGFLTALILALKRKSLITVAAFAAIAVLLAEIAIVYIPVAII
ncbi:MAG: AzlD domain-containing protein [Clostridia bacterium]|nr:AzlD domain-containing protein [Clostridia bacterium]MBO5206472.1 AzlD domain-containing protein [Clostridia bacterium]